MCVLLIATSVSSCFTWIPFLLDCFLSRWPQAVSVNLPFKPSHLCVLVLRKIHIHALWNRLKTRHWAGRYVVIAFPETSYTSCTHPMTSLAVPTKKKLPILSTLLPHWHEDLCSNFLSRGICSCTHLLAPCWGWWSCASPYPLCLSQYCGQLWSCSLPQVALQGMKAHFYLSLLLTAAWSICLSMWIWKMLTYRRISYSCSLPYCNFSPCHWHDFLT